ncbi:nitronate monooxygenase [Massilia sp. B-10]|nr:nitronate monooxygenase [Massilia sp. B-10]
MGTVTTVDEALAWELAGADAVVASGIEAGGHRGTFLGPQEDATLLSQGTMAARGRGRQDSRLHGKHGIMTGVDINEALSLGATAVQMGSAFLVCDESGINPHYRQALLQAGNTPTRLTAFSGRYARGLENRFMQQMKDVERHFPAYPVQNALTSGIRAAAAASGDTGLMSLWAGAEIRRARPMSVAKLMQTLVAEMRTV